MAKLGIVEEECDEVSYWLKMIESLELIGASKLQNLTDETNEILAITISSIKTTRSNLLKQSQRAPRKNTQFSTPSPHPKI